MKMWSEQLTRDDDVFLIKPHFSGLLSVAAWTAERTAYGATQVWVASGYLHHKSLGVPPQSWRHVDHPRWTLSPPHLLALGSTAPSTLDSHGHPLRPGARKTLATHVGRSIPPPTINLPRILSSPSFLLPQCRSPVSTSLRFLLSQVFFFIWRGAGVCVSFSPRHIHCVLQLFLHQFLLPSFLLHLPPPFRALTVNVEPGTAQRWFLHSFS